MGRSRLYFLMGTQDTPDVLGGATILFLVIPCHATRLSDDGWGDFQSCSNKIMEGAAGLLEGKGKGGGHGPYRLAGGCGILFA